MSEGISGIARADVKILFVDRMEPIEYKGVGIYQDAAYFGIVSADRHLLYLFPHRSISKIEIKYNLDNLSEE